MYTIQPMTTQEAQMISTWEYPDPYDFYNIRHTSEHPADILNDEIRQQSFYSVYREQEIIGLYEFHFAEHVCTMGLGLKPELTGQKLGQSFVWEAIDYIEAHYPEITVIELAVVSFNERALTVYERCGFEIDSYELMMANGTLHEFIRMRKYLS